LSLFEPKKGKIKISDNKNPSANMNKDFQKNMLMHRCPPLSHIPLQVLK